jgi:hypothetical protein
MGRFGPPNMQIVPTQVGGLSGVIGQGVNEDDFDLRAKTYTLDLNEADVLNLTIRMADGSNGQISIKGTTIAQIILDRNAKAVPVQDPESTTTEIQVGDGDISDAPVIPLKLANADEILTASQRAKQREEQRQAMLDRHGFGGKSPY